GGQNDAARQPTPRRLGWYADAPRGPQHFWHGECPRHLRWLVAPPAQRETFCANAGCLRRRATLCRFLDRRQYQQLESPPNDDAKPAEPRPLGVSPGWRRHWRFC